jgi:uncharacterized protein (DUF1501 family)
MLTLYSNGYVRNCEGYSRREFLRVGSLALGGLSLAQTLALRAAAQEVGSPVRDKSVVLLFLQGGPTHVETFDPKMTAPREYRAMFGEVQTSIPGLTFGSHFERMAQLAHRMAVVRSFRHGNSSHASASQLVASGGNPTKANLGSLFARLAGTNHPTTGMPRNVIINPDAISEKYKGLYKQVDRIGYVGDLGNSYAPFDPAGGGEIKANMTLRLPRARFDDRRSLLQELDTLRRSLEHNDVLQNADSVQRQAFDVILGGVAEAFDLSREDPRTLAMYDTSKMRIPDSVLKSKRNNAERFHPVALGHQMLLARRLCEAGCGYVTVSSSGWDMHGNALGIDDGIPALAPAVDKAVAAFLQDVEQRGLSDRILLVITGEFGRTPKINSKAGRDHWGNLCPLVFAGGGLQMGQVIGASDRNVSVPATDPISVSDVMATIMHTLFDIGTLRVVRGLPTNIVRAVEAGQPIPQLV